MPSLDPGPVGPMFSSSYMRIGNTRKRVQLVLASDIDTVVLTGGHVQLSAVALMRGLPTFLTFPAFSGAIGLLCCSRQCCALLKPVSCQFVHSCYQPGPNKPRVRPLADSLNLCEPLGWLTPPSPLSSEQLCTRMLGSALTGHTF